MLDITYNSDIKFENNDFLKEYGPPMIDPCSAKRSFSLHISKTNLGRFPWQQKFDRKARPDEDSITVHPKVSAKEYLQASEYLINVAYKPLKHNAYAIMDDWFEQQFETALTDLDPKSSPGFCFLKSYGSTNGDALKWDPFTGSYDETRVSLLRQAVRSRIDRLLLGELEADNIKVFVKQEPHTAAKIQEGRYRLISAVSVVDSMIDRMLFLPLMERILDRPAFTPCWVGWTFQKGGYKNLLRKFKGSTVVAVDKSSWDWTCMGWLLDMMRNIIPSFYCGAPKFLLELIDARFRLLFRYPIYEFSDGTVVAQPAWGVMKSGCYLTILLNSMCQTLLHAIAMIQMGYRPSDYSPVCMGDDTLQRWFVEFYLYMEKLRELGCKLKPTEPSANMEFAGFEARPVTNDFIPCYVSKHKYILQHVDPTVMKETLDSYQIMYGFHTPMFEEIQSNITRNCPDIFRRRSIILQFLRGSLDLSGKPIE